MSDRSEFNNRLLHERRLHEADIALAQRLMPCCSRHVTRVGVSSPTACEDCGRTLVVRDQAWRVASTGKRDST